ncbi:MAG: DsrE family protein [Chloroflexi bacterium]|nr:DsrE family protein [Chloroflexota bacterium]
MDEGNRRGKLGILLTTTPESENTHTVVRLAEAALTAGKEVRIFLMCDGVHNTNDARFMSLIEKGAQISLCAYNADQRHVAQKDQVLWGSQYDLAGIVEESDRFIAFN